MLLTLYYMAATWMQAWRLSSMRSKITQLLSYNGSLVLYKEPDPEPADSEVKDITGSEPKKLVLVHWFSTSNMTLEEVLLLTYYWVHEYSAKIVAHELELAPHTVTDWFNFCREVCDVILSGVMTPQLVGASSRSCFNWSEARVGDLLWYSNGKRACSLFPEQRVDVTTWIRFRSDRCLFPIEVSGNTSQVVLCDDRKLHVLIEADYLKASSIRDANYCQLEQFGVPQVWQAGDYFGLILETDVEHLTKLGSRFMTSKMSIDDGMELIRIESVNVEGLPCLMLNVDSIPISRSSAMCDELGPADLQSPVDEVMERRVGVQMSPVQWRSHVELLQSFTEAAGQAVCSQEETPVGGYTSAVLVAGNQPLSLNPPTMLPIPPDIEQELSKLEQAAAEKEAHVAPLEEKSVDSFYSLSDEVENHEVVAPSPIPEEDHTLPPVSPRESKSSDSFCSLASASTVSVSSAPILAIRKPSKHMKPFTAAMKPPNILVYSESSVALENVTTVLHSTLHRDKYAIYPVSKAGLLTSPWSDNTVLLVVCGSVTDSLAPRFLNYLLNGGRVLCLCSDLLHLVLPTFRTAEVRERELVQFSYARWKQVRMMHHIFCYQASPARTRFSPREPRDQEPPAPSARAPQPPSSVQVVDGDNETHTLHVQVLGAEETWHTPSLLLATVAGTGGKVVFSQVHLEVDPTQYEDEETKFAALKHSNAARLEIIQDLLVTHLGLECAVQQVPPQYTPAYFLGRHEAKLEFLNKLHGRLEGESILKLSRITLQFCSAKGVEPPKAAAGFMPVLVHACPSNFSTIEYFENLQSDVIGRLVIYSEVMTSSMDILAGSTLQHGLAVVSCHQTKGMGRGNNVWLSPLGCAMFSLQLHIPLTSYLGQHTPLIQHIVALAVVSAMCNLPGYQNLDLRLKWPNDIYAGRSAKLGGLVVNSRIESSMAVCDIGCGVNLDNSAPTTCINDMIKQLNSTMSEKLAPLSREKLLALTFTQLEGLLNAVEAGQMHKVLDQYYSYWLHSDAEITVVGPRGSSQQATVVGVDDFGFLRVRGQDGASFSVHPDGNSFDMLRGLIAPSVK